MDQLFLMRLEVLELQPGYHVSAQTFFGRASLSRPLNPPFLHYHSILPDHQRLHEHPKVSIIREYSQHSSTWFTSMALTISACKAGRFAELRIKVLKTL